MSNFHISLPCKELKKTQEFYKGTLKCKLGRKSNGWLDVDLYGNQITFIDSVEMSLKSRFYNFDGVILPSFHFGVLLPHDKWCLLWESLKDSKFVKIKPTTFLKEKVGEHDSFFISDPNDFTIEFKTFKQELQVFQGF